MSLTECLARARVGSKHSDDGWRAGNTRLSQGR